MKALLNQVAVNPVGILVLLCAAAFLETFGDSFFQSALYRSSGATRGLYFILGALVLASYALLVNAVRWDFGKLLGVYVVLFFLMAQIIAKVRFNQPPTPHIMVGGLLIAVGGIVIAFSRP